MGRMLEVQPEGREPASAWYADETDDDGTEVESQSQAIARIARDLLNIAPTEPKFDWETLGRALVDAGYDVYDSDSIFEVYEN